MVKGRFIIFFFVGVRVVGISFVNNWGFFIFILIWLLVNSWGVIIFVNVWM